LCFAGVWKNERFHHQNRQGSTTHLVPGLEGAVGLRTDLTWWATNADQGDRVCYRLRREGASPGRGGAARRGVLRGCFVRLPQAVLSGASVARATMALYPGTPLGVDGVVLMQARPSASHHHRTRRQGVRGVPKLCLLLGRAIRPGITFADVSARFTG